ncbi:GyrI-like domain-containing protein [Costertonia aggregata]|uniref:GyrI-like domain-containing protein n=1 Tax=Costertonia aggregata TaxID=343403 RepID=A0A7H9AQ19_9FLAO|nr:GyrI-like domain-containing protein [Costertonia aggregata]QLG45345.1 GyrI-like domain-containing protein [Costertonia aggregata]
MNPRIETIAQKKLVGKSLRMSLTNNKTRELWQNFMPLRKRIQNTVGINLYSLQVYDDSYFSTFNPNTEFTKWAAVEVSNYGSSSEGLEKFTLDSGLYAIFHHKGPANGFQETVRYIFGRWLPNSDYLLDDRPHFELLGANYKNNDPDSEEEIWIPIKSK